MGASGSSIGGMNCYMTDGECSCFHSVLQCLLMHPVMKICWNKYNFNINNIKNNNAKYPLTLEIIKIYSTIMQGKTANSSKFINIFRNVFNQNKNNFGIDAYSINTPGKFLYFFLLLLHNELNESQKNFNINLINNMSFNQKKNLDSLMSLFIEYITKCHKDSIIFQYFFNTEKIIYNCIKCGIYYDCDIKNIFYIDLSSIYDYIKRIKPNASRFNVNLYECFDYYCNNNNVICQYCQTNIIRYVKIFNGKTLIIRLKRNSNNANSKCDVDFPIKFNISKYKACNEGNKEYFLKGCISYGPINNSNNWKYIADINLDPNINSEGRWIRYIDSNSSLLESSKRIYDFEPQILIYQLNDLEENNNNINNNNINNNNDIINNNQNSSFIYNNFINMDNNINNNFNNNNQFNGNMNNSNNLNANNNNNFNSQNNLNFSNYQNNNNNINYNSQHNMIINNLNNNEVTNNGSLQGNNFILNNNQLY